MSQAGFATDWRFAAVQNNAAEDIPPYALCRVSGKDGNGYFVSKPNENDQGGLFVNFDAGIKVSDGAGGMGKGRAITEAAAVPVPVLYNPADGVPTAGETWGAKAGEWWLRKGYTGYKIDGEADGTKVWAMASCCEDEDCGCGTGPPPSGCQVTPPPSCAPCLMAVVITAFGDRVSVPLLSQGTIPGACTYMGSDASTLIAVSVSVSISASGISTQVSQTYGSNYQTTNFFSCTAWDGSSCINVGSQVGSGGGGGLSNANVESICPSADCPNPFGGGGGGGGGGIGGGGTGGGGCPPGTIGSAFGCVGCPGVWVCDGTGNQATGGCWCDTTTGGVGGGTVLGGGLRTAGGGFAVSPTDPIAYAEELTAGQVPVVGTTTTTTNAPVTGATVPITLNKAAELEITIVGWQTGGSAGTVGDSVYVKTFDYFKNVAGVVSRIGGPGAPAPLVSKNDDALSPANFNATISGTNVLVPVTGNTNRNYRWQVSVKKREY